MTHDKLIEDAARAITRGYEDEEGDEVTAATALAPALAMLDNLAEPAAALVDMIANDYDRPEVATAWNRLRIALIPLRAALTQETTP